MSGKMFRETGKGEEVAELYQQLYSSNAVCYVQPSKVRLIHDSQI